MDCFTIISNMCILKIKYNSTHYRSGKKILDMCIDPVQICGFSVVVRHGEEGISTQVMSTIFFFLLSFKTLILKVKVIRVIGITTDAGGEMSSVKQLSKIIIPKCKPNTELHYYFPTPTTANIVTFEFVSSYHDSSEPIPPRITLFTVE